MENDKQKKLFFSINGGISITIYEFGLQLSLNSHKPHDKQPLLGNNTNMYTRGAH